jgi:hypothetical protein
MQEAALTPVSTTKISIRMEVARAAELLMMRYGPEAALKDGGHREVERAPRPQSTGGDCFGDRSAFSFPPLKKAGYSGNL